MLVPSEDLELNAKKPKEFWAAQPKQLSKLTLLPNLKISLWQSLVPSSKSFAFLSSNKPFLQWRKFLRILEFLRAKYMRWC